QAVAVVFDRDDVAHVAVAQRRELQAAVAQVEQPGAGGGAQAGLTLTSPACTTRSLPSTRTRRPPSAASPDTAPTWSPSCACTITSHPASASRGAYRPRKGASPTSSNRVSAGSQCDSSAATTALRDGA